MLDQMEAIGAKRTFLFSDIESGLRAILVIDDMTLGPAAGGIRTADYESDHLALAEAQRLAAAMTIKCAISGLAAGGAKMIVLDHPGLNRPMAFRRLGAFVEDLGGRYWSAGDIGTSPADLAAISQTTRYVNPGGAELGLAVGETVLNGIRACAELTGRKVADLSVAIQGCGVVGEGVARVLARENMAVYLADLRHARAQLVAAELGARVIAPEDVLSAEVDIVAPCAQSGSITAEALKRMKAWAICGGANNQLAGPDAADALRRSNILYIPDFLASTGAVIAGLAGPLMNTDKNGLIAQTYHTAQQILAESERTGVGTEIIGFELARHRLRGATPQQF